MTTSSPSPLNSIMYTTCTPAAQVKARDAGRRYRKIIADTEWGQAYGVQRESSQSLDTTNTQNGATSLQSSGFAQNMSQVEDLLKEW